MQKENETSLRDQVWIEKKNLIPTYVTLKHIKQWANRDRLFIPFNWLTAKEQPRQAF